MGTTGNDMQTIKFSHRYNKLKYAGNPMTAKLIEVIPVNRKDLSEQFIAYDTLYWDDDGEPHFYELKAGKYLLLVFLTHSGIFTTVRPARGRFTGEGEKEKYYRDMIGKEFDVQCPE